MRERLFASLEIYNDIDSRTAAVNMAIDETLLEGATQPAIRFYRWDHPALSFGYFGRFADIENHKRQRDIVRRWTGGGVVFHREDLTYSIVIPASDRAFSESTLSIYTRIHCAMRAALAMNGQSVELAAVAAASDCRSDGNSAIGDRHYTECFAKPVPADVLWNGQKVAGAAQRRTRRGLLQQGSIQDLELADDFRRMFAAQLSENCVTKDITNVVLDRAHEISNQKYRSESWLRKR